MKRIEQKIEDEILASYITHFIVKYIAYSITLCIIQNDAFQSCISSITAVKTRFRLHQIYYASTFSRILSIVNIASIPNSK